LPGDSKPRVEVITRQPGTWGTDQDYSVKIDPSTPDGKIELMLELKLVDRHSKQDHDKRTFCFVVARGNTPLPGQSCGAEGDSASAADIYQVKKDADVRGKPSAKASVLAHVRRGESFPVAEKQKQGSGLWYKIKLEDGREGWLPASLGTIKKP
jgi:hypothetical protein